MATDIVILSVDDIMQLYGFNRHYVYGLLNVKGCPVLPRPSGAPYRVIRDEFEKWLRSRKG